VALESGYLAALLVDWRQTSDYHRHTSPCLQRVCQPGDTTYTYLNAEVANPVPEENPLLGHYPSQATINAACLLSAAGHLLISQLLPTGWRPVWQGVTLGIELGMVARNHYCCCASIRF